MQLQRTTKQRFQLNDRRRITFYAATFDTETRIKERNASGEIVEYTEVIRRGAFDATLDAWGEVIADIDHNPETVFARRSDGSLLLQSDPHGLWCSCWIPEGPEGDAILADIESGKLDGCSFQFSPVQDRTTSGVTERLAVNLYDVCLTANPAFPGTEVHLRTKQDRTNLTRLQFEFLKLKMKG